MLNLTAQFKYRDNLWNRVRRSLGRVKSSR